MADNFRLKLVRSDGRLSYYEGTVDGTQRWAITPDAENDVVRASEINGVTIEGTSMNMSTGEATRALGSDREAANFVTMAAHLCSQFKRSGVPPNEIQKHFC
ncbi:hypothetical protein [Streptomyces sp. NPDC088725]|uniref:hypothetical protein n=1 Tax=Streptomyces sp. NPDC088725 TaxID=3365873 RepID=UPI0037F38332